MIEQRCWQQTSETGAFQRRIDLARSCAVVILAIAVIYVLKLPSGGLAGLSYDGFRYLAGAHSILESGTYLDISGAPQAHWPPGTSLLYAAVANLSEEPPENLATAINIIAIILMAGSLWLIIELTISRWWLAIIAFAGVLFNTAILSMHNKLLSDPLALATCSAAIASGIIASRAGKNWYGWIWVASVFISIALSIRFAILPAVFILTAIAFLLSKKTSAHREAFLIPLMSPLLMFTLFFIFRPSGAYPNTDNTPRIHSFFSSLDFENNWRAFVELFDQVLPVQSFTILLSGTIVGFAFFAIPAAVTLSGKNLKSSALSICVGYTLTTFVFLIFVAAISNFNATRLRYLLQVYPFIIIGAAITADLIADEKKIYQKALAAIIIVLLCVAATRATRAVALGLLNQGSHEQLGSCVTRGTLLKMLTETTTLQSLQKSPRKVLSNSQGVAWYATRLPTAKLTQSSLETAPPGTIIIFARPDYACPEVLEGPNVSEATLTGSPDVSIFLTNSALLLGKKNYAH